MLYFFSVVNALQGVFIFLHFFVTIQIILRNKSILPVFLKKMMKNKKAKKTDSMKHLDVKNDEPKEPDLEDTMTTIDKLNSNKQS